MILVGSGVISIISFLTQYYSKNYSIADYLTWCTSLFGSIFILSIVIYFLKEQIFLSWRKFTLWWILISFFFVYISPTQDNFFGNIAEGLALIFGIGYFFVSTILIIYKSIKLRKQ